MFGLSTWEILIVLLMALVFIGPDQLPRVARKLGEGMRQVRGAMTRVDAEVRTAIREATAEDALAEEEELARKRAAEHPLPAGAPANRATAGSGLTLTPLHEHDAPGAEAVGSGPSSGSAPGSSAPSSGSAPGSSAPGSSGPSSGSAPGSSGPSSGSAPGSSGGACPSGPASPVATAHNADPAGLAAAEPLQPHDEPVFEAESGGGVVVRRPPAHAVPRTPASGLAAPAPSAPSGLAAPAPAAPRVVEAGVRPVADGASDVKPPAGPSA